jgi:hypothetical protein
MTENKIIQHNMLQSMSKDLDLDINNVIDAYNRYIIKSSPNFKPNIKINNIWYYINNNNDIYDVNGNIVGILYKESNEYHEFDKNDNLKVYDINYNNVNNKCNILTQLLLILFVICLFMLLIDDNYY